jgi:hypothetical protein
MKIKKNSWHFKIYCAPIEAFGDGPADTKIRNKKVTALRYVLGVVWGMIFLILMRFLKILGFGIWIIVSLVSHFVAFLVGYVPVSFLIHPLRDYTYYERYHSSLTFAHLIAAAFPLLVWVFGPSFTLWEISLLLCAGVAWLGLILYLLVQFYKMLVKKIPSLTVRFK